MIACLQNLRRSPSLVIVVVFVALMLDVMLMTCIDPILPDMLDKLSLTNTNDTLMSPLMNSSQFTTEPNNGSQSGKENEEDSLLTFSIHVQLGIMVAAKPATEMISNIAVGFLVDRIGHRLPMTVGFGFNVLATIGFAYSTTYVLLLVTRIAQAIGSSLSVVAGLAYLASVFTEDAERGKATGRAFSGVSLGVILGYPFGSIIYDLWGRAAPFLILAGVSLLDGLLRLLLVSPQQYPSNKNNNEESIEIKRHGCGLLKDKLIWICLGCVFFQHASLGIFLATGPAWMLNDLNAEQWTIGTVLGICVVFHLFAQITVGELGLTDKRWIALWIGLIIIGIGNATYPLCSNIWQVIGPEGTIRLGHGIALCVLSPLLAHLVDIRHGEGSYGAVYGLYTTFYNMGLTAGPIIGGVLRNYLSFSRLYWGTAVVVSLYSCLCVCLRPQKRSTIYKNHKKKNSLLKSTSDYGSLEDETMDSSPVHT